MKREKELLERELAIARREIEFLREERLREAIERNAVTGMEAGQAGARRVMEWSGDDASEYNGYCGTFRIF